ncbi:hypothetical protein FHR24_000710 [Wenyingzhuangia heitensis]|uniref:Lipoprotein n=1 Tax=Wenyingzhuangia heitensis TaxID=1487859 RepID=A0ABX0U9M5_9FLAO|nr:hypothetical protein [Wenyingzhuangia heitensis]NIJ44271.1 hypothetical protein [Wenyingzhuangia heitensis]
MKIRIFVLAMILFACEGHNKIEMLPICKVHTPLEELIWLQDFIKKSGEYEYYMTAKYKGNRVFYYGDCNPLVNYQSVVYNCKG